MSGQDMIRQLVADLDAANERAKAAEAEVAGWRRAVRWETHGPAYRLVLGNDDGGAMILAEAWRHPDGWWGSRTTMSGPFADRNTACAKVCELLGIPVVLPVGGE
jgi:hypothetical protein